MKYTCDICGRECEFDYELKEDEGYFVVCDDCNHFLDAGVYARSEGGEG